MQEDSWAFSLSSESIIKVTVVYGGLFILWTEEDNRESSVFIDGLLS